MVTKNLTISKRILSSYRYQHSRISGSSKTIKYIKEIKRIKGYYS